MLYKINQTEPQSPGGLYQITRYYDKMYHDLNDPNDELSPLNTKNPNRKDKQVRNYFFVVDRNHVIETSGRPFESEINLQFIPPPEDQVDRLPRNAIYSDFYKTTVTNAQAVKFNLPNYDTKYGGKGVYDINIFEGNFDYSQNMPNWRTPTVDMPKDFYENEDEYHTKKPWALNILDLNMSAETYTYEKYDKGADEWNTMGSSGKVDSFPKSRILNQSNNYIVTVRDKSSAGVSWQPFGKTTFDCDEKSNKSKVDFRIDNNSISAFWKIHRVNQNSETRNFYYGYDEWTQYRPGDEAGFYFINDTSGFMSPINDGAVQVVISAMNAGKTTTFQLGGPEQVGLRTTETLGALTTTTYDLTQILNDIRDGKRDGSNKKYELNEIRIGLSSPATGLRSYYLKIDNDAPAYNLARVRDPSTGDKLFDMRNVNQAQNTQNPDGSTTQSWDKFIYSLPNTFVFAQRMETLTGKVDVGETDQIAFQRVDASLNPISAWVTKRQGFVYQSSNVDLQTPFAKLKLVNLQETEIAFFCIKETDRAGNETMYFIRLCGSKYENRIRAAANAGPFYKSSVDDVNLIDDQKGAAKSWWQKTQNSNFQYVIPHLFLKDAKLGTITDINEGFFLNNPNFVFSYTIGNTGTIPTTFTRYKYGMAQSTVQDFAAYLNTMLERSVNDVVKITYKDGFGTKYYNISQIRAESAPVEHKIKIRKSGNNLDDITMEIENFTTLYNKTPQLLNLYNIGNRYRVELFPFKDGTYNSNPLDNERLFKYTLQENVFWDWTQSFNGASTIIRNYKQYGQGFVVRVTDSFGRATTIEYHGDDLTPSVKYAKSYPYMGMQYVGDPNGATITYNSNRLDLEVYRDNKLINYRELYNVVDGIDSEFTQIKITPEDNYSDTSQFEVRFKYKIIGKDEGVAPAFVYQWKFYRLLPDLTFQNINGTILNNEMGKVEYDERNNLIVPTLNGIVEVNVDNSKVITELVDKISYIQYYVDELGEEKTYEKTMRPSQERFFLDQEGIYELTLKNYAGAVRIFRFQIREVDNMDFKLFYKDKQLFESPTQFEYKKVYPTLVSPYITYKDDAKTVPADNKNLPEYMYIRNIPVYWVNAKWDRYDDPDPYEPTNPKTYNRIKPQDKTFTGMDGMLRLVPSMNNNRSLVWVEGGTNRTTEVGQIENSTVSWNIYYLFADNSGTRLYFVIACTGGADEEDDNRAEVVPQVVSGNGWINQIGDPFAANTNLYRLYRQIKNGAVSVEVTTKGTLAHPHGKPVNTLAEGICQTNVYYIDYYQNGIYGGRILHGEKLNITEQDIGEIRLEMGDWANNRQFFTDSNTSQRRDYFTIYNFAKPPLIISSKNITETITDEMLYNDFFELGTCQPPWQSTSAFFISSLVITKDGEEVFNYATKEKPESFTAPRFTEPGRYRIECEYNTGTEQGLPGGVYFVKSTHIIQLVDSGTSNFVSAFTFSGASNIRIVQVRYGNSRIDISREFGINANNPEIRSISLNEKNGSGLYRITFLVDRTNVRQSYKTTRDVYLLSLGTVSNLIELNKTAGLTHKGSVMMRFIPQSVLWSANGSANITVTLDGKKLGEYNITPTMQKKDEDGNLVDVNLEEYITREFKSSGKYQITVTAQNGTVISAEGFAIEGTMNPTLLYILLGIAAVFMGGMVIFIRMRAKMRVK
jgi:hypothetical protein